jgi:hypothetical protein
MVFMEKTTSEMNFDDIADILPGKENVFINVRVLRLWKVHAFLNPSESSSIEMVLVDQKVRFISMEVTYVVVLVMDLLFPLLWYCNDLLICL